MESIYEHAGGQESLRRFIDIFYGSVLADPVLSRCSARDGRSTSTT